MFARLDSLKSLYVMSIKYVQEQNLVHAYPQSLECLHVGTIEGHDVFCSMCSAIASAKPNIREMQVDFLDFSPIFSRVGSGQSLQPVSQALSSMPEGFRLGVHTLHARESMNALISFCAQWPEMAATLRDVRLSTLDGVHERISATRFAELTRLCPSLESMCWSLFILY